MNRTTGAPALETTPGQTDWLSRCDLVLPCRNEAPALRRLLPTVPEGIHVIVVDNGSTDQTAAVAGELGATVVAEGRPGYGAAVHAGLMAATREIVAVMDGDGSFDPTELPRLVHVVGQGQADLVTGRRRPTGRGVWPWHARAGNGLIVTWMRRRHGLPISDIAPLRVARRADLEALGVADRRFGYPVELLARAVESQWRIREYDVSYRPRAAGTRSKVSGSVVGSARTALDFWRVLR